MFVSRWKSYWFHTLGERCAQKARRLVRIAPAMDYSHRRRDYVLSADGSDAMLSEKDDSSRGSVFRSLIRGSANAAQNVPINIK